MQPQLPSTTVRGSRRTHSTVQVRRNRYRIIPSGLLALHDPAMEYSGDWDSGLVTPPILPSPGSPSWDLSLEAVARHERGMLCGALGGLRDHEPKAEREMKQALFPQPDRLEQIKPSFYLCDQSAVQLMVKAVTEAWPCPLGAWVRQELDAGHLWSCKVVDAVRGWKVCTPAPRGADYGTREAVLRLLATLRTEFPLVTVTVDEAVMFDTVQTYAWAESTIEDAPRSRTCRRLVTANRAFE
jgi:hypothetical protein